MNSRSLLVVSILFNLVLLAAFAFNARRDSTPVAPKIAPAVTTTVPARRNAMPIADAAPKPVREGGEAFHWRSVEAEDYKKYIANLRGIGCPEETIRDIIVADVTKLYAQKLTAAARAKEFKYWQNSSSKQKLSADNRRTARDLDRDKWTLLRDLLGSGVEAEYRKGVLSADTATEETVLAFLPEAKRSAVREIVERHTEQESELQRRGAFTQKERAELKQLRERRTAELAGVLTPEELEGYELRTSNTAENLRNRIAGVDLAENQFRQMFRLQKSFDDEFNKEVVQFDATTVERRNTSQRKLDEDVKSLLGEQLYTEMRRAQDPAWRGLVEVGREQNIPAETLNKVFEMKKLVEDNLRAALSDANIPRENRMATLKSMGEQTEHALVQLLGEKGWEAYKQNGGYWVPGQQGGTTMWQTVTAGGDNVRVVRTIQIDGGSATISMPPGAVGGFGGSSGERKVILQPGPAPAKP